VDVQLFTSRLEAIDEEEQSLAGHYVPNPAAYYGFQYSRFRPGFRPAVHAAAARPDDPRRFIRFG
jgi:hypothetical protein